MMENITSKMSRQWADLPLDLLESLLLNVSLVDTIRLCAVCKGWNFTSDLVPKAKTWPWLMYQEKMDGTYKLLDPLNHGKEYTIKIGLPSSVFPTQILYSRDGWVVMLDGNRAIFLVNPMTQEVVELPVLEELDRGFHGVTFVLVLNSPDCVVMGTCTNTRHNYIKIHVWHFEEEEWVVAYDGNLPLRIANTNPVPFHGMLFFLGRHGELGFFNLVEETWVMLDEPEPIYSNFNAPFRGKEDYHLLELDGESVSVCKYNYSDYEIRVFKFDRLELKWIPVEDLTGWTLFLDPKSSFAQPSPHKSWSNKIFFTLFHTGTTKACVVYCMESKRYEINFCDAKQPLDCVWLEPSLIRKNLTEET